ncbi:tRNA (N6-isopentenyl adenosine(37)-C2)-methylthiotransferase MiaB [Candidatus Karelsulcia muelleri]|uniref:tRNA-2-methylthio-N(6)-dimethylallyladenosine synthase n=1 Tax=Candidatus Karelsulcia muelleri TaxID=336810 RepID=A0A3A1MMB7_9FLAO|nr:tRNA (N6-isopentenyl adenosine(37)-C2)-methylthiotransferase MiaB [Candidatus Karelsulcia muelleri]RIU86063.1 tRNA (N6-isopentenyl adenosine(37)-C2)-methylthiotransferase MiaB [Candidatus Karelsulcia muelleri]
MINKKFYIENYGCQMNISDSEIVSSILNNKGFIQTENLKEANIILINTCSIRDKSEKKILLRINQIKFFIKKNNYILIGILGCMAYQFKNIKEKKLINLVVGPDSYREIPNLINNFFKKKGEYISTSFSKTETYADILPKREEKKITAFVTIMRGCDNMCTFCVVPFTRGREKSRDPYSIIKECKFLFKKGYKEIILLGQNVDSYLWYGGGLKKQFKIKEIKNEEIINFSKLLELVAISVPLMRIRFCTSNPNDMSDNVLNVIKKYINICKHIHLPVQSGSNRILSLMNRKHTCEDYILLIKKIKNIIPNCSLSCDIITGFCNENENDHNETLHLMNYVKYNFSYMFIYSHRIGTYASKKLIDNVSLSTKKRRLTEIINLQKTHSYYRNIKYIGSIQDILIEGISTKNINFFYGRNSGNDIVIFPKTNYKIGDFIKVKIKNCTSATLVGDIYL